MKIFLSDSILSIILKVILILLNIFAIFYSIFTQNVWWEFIIIFSFILSLGFFILFNACFGYIKIKEQYIMTLNSITTKNNRIQNRIKADIDDIISIEFVEEECTSDGNKITWRYTGIPPYLKLYMKDNSILRIHLAPYSHRTWKNLEKILLERNDNIILIKDAKSFIKFRKTGSN